MIDIHTVLTYLTLISIPVGVAYHIMTLNNTRKNQQLQLETRQTQLFMQTYQKVATPELQTLTSELNGWEWKDFDDFKEKYFDDPKKQGDWASTMVLFDGLGVLMKEHFIDPEMLFNLEQSGTRGGVLLWFKFKPIIYEIRNRENNPELLKNMEYLVDEMIRLIKKHGFASKWAPEESIWIKE